MKGVERVGQVFKYFAATTRSDEMKGSYRTVGLGLYVMSRWTLAAVIHPIATVKASWQIGTNDDITSNAKKALSLPNWFVGRHRLKP